MSNYAEDLKVLVVKAYPHLQEGAREQMTLTQFITQNEVPQMRFSVRQERPETMDAATSATLEWSHNTTQIEEQWDCWS